jgi:hypothetical protein
MTINTQSIASILRQLAAVAAVVLGALPVDSLPASVRAPLVALGGALLTVEHYLSDPSTGNNVTHPAPPAPAPPVVAPPAPQPPTPAP